MTEGDDVGRECSGNTEAFEQMLGTMNHGGRIALLGILPGKTAIQWSNVLFKGLVLKGVYGREMVETWYEMATLLRSGKVVLDWTSGPPQA